LTSERPDRVAEELISFDNANPFQPIEAGGAVHLNASNHGSLTDGIHHRAPCETCGSPIAASSINASFGLPILCNLEPVFSLCSSSMHSLVLSLSTFLLLALPLLLACLLAASSTLQSPLPFHHHGPSTAAPASFALPASPAVLTTAIDDMSLGFMQRVVHLCLS
jgi:hypothetical protein